MMLLENKTIIPSSSYLKINEQYINFEQVSLLLFKVWHENYLKTHPGKNAGVWDYLYLLSQYLWLENDWQFHLQVNNNLIRMARLEDSSMLVVIIYSLKKLPLNANQLQSTFDIAQMVKTIQE